MRTILLGLVVLEATALAAASGYLVFGDVERHRRRAPSAPVFKPPLYNAVIGDKVRYRVEDKNGNVTGYFEYVVVGAVVYRGTAFGRDFSLKLTRMDEHGRRLRAPRMLRVRPRAPGHSWLPPRFEADDDYPSGARPVIKSIRSLPPKRGSTGEFLVETVFPRDSLVAVAERYWIDPAVPVFGVRRWERDDEVWIHHSGEFMERAPQ